MRARVVHLGPPAPDEPGPARPRRLGLPVTWPGRRSLAFLGAAVVFWALMFAAIAAGVRGDSALLLEIAFLAVPVVSAFVAAIGAGALAVVSLFRGERSLLLALPVLIGTVALLFVIGEVAAPH